MIILIIAIIRAISVLQYRHFERTVTKTGYCQVSENQTSDVLWPHRSNESWILADIHTCCSNLWLLFEACAQKDNHGRDSWITSHKIVRTYVSRHQKPTDLLETRHLGEAGSATAKLELPERADLIRQRRHGIQSSEFSQVIWLLLLLLLACSL